MKGRKNHPTPFFSWLIFCYKAHEEHEEKTLVKHDI